jgi:cytoskeleton protein RodZ
MRNVNFFKKNPEKLNSENTDLIYNEETLGSLLKNKREEIKLDISEISKILKVRVIDINFLENNQIENISKNIYIPGFIISYAKILKIEQKLIDQKIQELSFRPNIDNKKHILVNIGEYRDLNPSKEVIVNSSLIFIILFLSALFYYSYQIKNKLYINHQYLIEELNQINATSTADIKAKTTN